MLGDAATLAPPAPARTDALARGPVGFVAGARRPLGGEPVVFGRAAAPAVRRRLTTGPVRDYPRAMVTGGALLALTLIGAPQSGALAIAAPLPGEQVMAMRADSGIGPLTAGSRIGQPRRDAPHMVPLPPDVAGVTLAATASQPRRVTLGLSDGMPLGPALARIGVRKGDADALLAAWDAARHAAGTPVDQPATLILAPPTARSGGGQALLAASVRPRLDLLLEATRDAAGRLVIQRRAVPVQRVWRRLSGTLGADGIWRATQRAGVAPDLAAAYLQALGPRIASDGTARPGDRFDLVAEVPVAAGGLEGAGTLAYAALRRGDATVVKLVAWPDGGGRRQWLSAADARDRLAPPVAPDEGQDGGGAVRPADGPVTSAYGGRRHPILGYWRMHNGTDFGGGYGAPVRAASAGVVDYAGWNGGYGRFVRLSHGAGLGSGYAHLSRSLVAPGQRVAAGQVIGLIGSTGFSTGPHLHFEVYRNGRPVDPALLGRLAGVGARVAAPSLPPAAYRAFQARLRFLEGVGTATAPPAAPPPAAAGAPAPDPAPAPGVTR